MTLDLILITICLALAGMAAIQAMYLIYLGSIEKAHKSYIRDLEKRCKLLEEKLAESGEDADQEIWARVIDER